MVHHHELHQNTLCKCSKCTRRRKAIGITLGVICLGGIILWFYEFGNSQLNSSLRYAFSPIIWLLVGVIIGALIGYKIILKYQRKKAYMRQLAESIESRKGTDYNEARKWYCSLCRGSFTNYESYVQHHHRCHP
jgi:hypothetical protein